MSGVARGEWKTGPGGRVVPFVAAGDLVLVVVTGDGWVLDTDGEKVPAAAPAIITWEPGERVAYGTDAADGWRVQYFWGSRTRSDGFHPNDE